MKITLILVLSLALISCFTEAFPTINSVFAGNERNLVDHAKTFVKRQVYYFRFITRNYHFFIIINKLIIYIKAGGIDGSSIAQTAQSVATRALSVLQNGASVSNVCSTLI